MKKNSLMVLFISIIYVVSSYSQIRPAQPISKDSLGQNYPEPFGLNGTSIPFWLPKADSVSLWVEDTSGNIVSSLMSKYCAAGNHTCIFLAPENDSSISRTYVCKLEVDSQKIVLFRDSILMHCQIVTEIKENASNVQPSYFRLNQNYPNPFNPSTIISFNLAEKSFVSLKVFDIVGREIATVVSEEMPAGSYSRQWNALNISSGIYFYRLQAGAHVQTKKLILLK